MKITVALLILLALFSPITPAADYAQMSLPDGAVARFGKGWIGRIVFSPDITRVAISGPIGVWLYDTATGQEVDLLTGQPDWVHKVTFSSDGRTLVSESADSVYLWDAVTGEPKGTLTTPSGGVCALAISPDGTTLASGGGDWDNFTVELWDTVKGEHKGTLTRYIYMPILAFSPDGTTLVSGSYDGTVLLWKVH
jgi:WD40 repeat protein